MKHCKYGGEWKPESEFGKRSEAKDGLNYTCKEHTKENDRKHYAKNPEPKRKSRKRWGTRNPEYTRKPRWNLIDLISPKCEEPNCNITDKDILDLHHINGDGNLQRKYFKNSINEYKYYLRHPELNPRKVFQVHCCNHHYVITRSKTKITSPSYILRNRAFDLYGDKCVRCGISNRLMLDLDHVHGGGVQERRNLGNQTIYKKYIEMFIDNPELAKQTMQVLCGNCNVKKRIINKEYLVN